MGRKAAITATQAFFLATIGLLVFLWQAQAQEASQILVDKVDASAFPKVIIDLTVADDLGVPLPELTAADIQIFEDGRKVPAGSITLEPDESQPIGLVLAVDLSTEAADLEEIKSGLRGLVERMRSTDQAVLLAFEDNVQLVQAATSDKTALLAAIDGLSVLGNYTSLNRVSVEAMNRAELLDVNRKAVVIVTDSVENINSLPLADVYSRADQVNIPIYLFAFSPKSQPASAMEAYGLRIKAKPFVTDTAAATRLRMLALGSLFQRGYQLRYTSALPADGKDHSISVNLAEGGTIGTSTNTPGSSPNTGSGSVAGPVQSLVSLVAQPGQMEIELPGLRDGQQVGGIVDLVPSISAPGPVRSVEFLVDGQSIGSATAAPYAFAWDTGRLVEGSHVVSVRAVDSAGNQGETAVTVTVVDPLKLQATIDRSRVYVGDELTVSVAVEALAGVGAVDLLIDGVRVDRRVEPPFVFSLDSSSYAQGEHIITIQATDTNGYLETTKFSLNLLPPAPRFIFTGQTWLRIFALLASVLAVVLAWLLLVWLAGASRRRRRRRFSLALDNLGNVISAYLVRADDAKGALRFFLLYKGTPLVGRTVQDWVPLSQEEWENLQFRAQTVQIQQAEAVYEMPVAPAASNGAAQGLGSAKESASAGLGKAKAGAGAGLAKLKGAGQATTKVADVAGAGAGLLYALGGFLPNALGGAALRRAAQGSMGAYRGVRSVERVQRHAGQIQNVAGGAQAPLTRAQQRDAERAQAAGFGTSHMEEVIAGGKQPASTAAAPGAAQVAAPAMP
ncbi:MAG: Ig-like domain-containing protein, partial [Caldilineaceae bacterium]